MNEIIVQVRSVEEKQYQKIWMDLDYVWADFIREWNCFHKRTAHLNEVYEVEEKRFLNVHQTVYESGLCSMDHIIVI